MRFSDVLQLSQMQSELNRLFDEALSSQGGPGAFQPRADVLETAETVAVQLEVAGARPEELEVNVEGNRITVRGRKPAATAAGGRYLNMERSRGEFSRTVAIPRPVHATRGVARLEKGVLTVELPRLVDRRGQPHRIVVEIPDAEERG